MSDNVKRIVGCSLMEAAYVFVLVTLLLTVSEVSRYTPYIVIGSIFTVSMPLIILFHSPAAKLMYKAQMSVYYKRSTVIMPREWAVKLILPIYLMCYVAGLIVVMLPIVLHNFL